MIKRTWSQTIARVAECLYAVLCLFLWLGLPFPPGADWVTSTYLATTAIAAAVLAWAWRRPTARVWYATAAFSAIVVTWQLLALPRLIALMRGDAQPPALVYTTGGVVLYDAQVTTVLMLSLGTAPAVLQAIVGACCYRLRQLRRVNREEPPPLKSDVALGAP